MKETLAVIRRQRRPNNRKVSRTPRWIYVAWVGSILAGAVGLVLVTQAVLAAGPMHVRKIDVQGTLRVSPEGVRGALWSYLDQPIFLISLSDVREKVLLVPGVKEAIVARRMPDLIDVRIVERRAVARVSSGIASGYSLLVDREGYVFPQHRVLTGDSQLPTLTGLFLPSGARQLASDDLSSLQALDELHRLTEGHLPTNLTLDLSRRDRMVLRIASDIPDLWLDRRDPRRNLASFFADRDRVVKIAGGRAIDLRIPERMTIQPAPAAPPVEEGDGAVPAEASDLNPMDTPAKTARLSAGNRGGRSSHGND